MYEMGQRLLDKDERPDAVAIAEWLGPKGLKFWTQVLAFIEENYPGVFPEDDWMYGGKKYGWALRFKKSKSFCTLIPERKRLVIQIVFGAAEREKAEAILLDLSDSVREAYTQAKTYHDGKWLALVVDRAAILDDVKQLLTIKRRPRPNQ
jgi:hypothetical protein